MSVVPNLESYVSLFKSVDFFFMSIDSDLESVVSRFKSVDFFFMSVDLEFRTVDLGKETVHFDSGTYVLNKRTIVIRQEIACFLRIPHVFAVILYFLPDITAFSGLATYYTSSSKIVV